MYIGKRHVRAWATIPAIVLIVAISVIAGPANAATCTTQVPLGAAGPFAVLVATAVTANALTTIDGHAAALAPAAAPVAPQAISTLIPVAVLTIQRLPSTSTNDAYQPLKPVNFVQGFALGFALVLIGWLLLVGLRRSV